MHVGKWSRVKGEQSFVGPITASLYSFFVRIVGIAIIGVVDLDAVYYCLRPTGIQGACGSGISIFTVFEGACG